MDRLDAFIADLHLMLGHDKTAAYLGVPAYDKKHCALCHPEVGKPEPVPDGQLGLFEGAL